MRFFTIIVVTILICCGSTSKAQLGGAPPDSNLVQFSGVVITADSLKALPYTSIIAKGTHIGTIADYYGYFSFVARKADTIEFSAIGYKKAQFVIPDSLTDNRYSLIQMMQGDTILLRETVIYPWPSREQFKEAFLALRVPDDDLERARKNLERERLRDLGEDLAMDGSENYRYSMQQYQNQLYYAGQGPPINLFNPIAWAKFIEAWRNGDFKKKE